MKSMSAKEGEWRYRQVMAGDTKLCTPSSAHCCDDAYLRRARKKREERRARKFDTVMAQEARVE